MNEVRDEAGFLKFLKGNEEHGKREVASIGYQQYGFRIADVEKFISQHLDAGTLALLTKRSGGRGRPKVVVTASVA